MPVSKQRIKRRKVNKARKEKVKNEVERKAGQLILENSILKARIRVLERKLGKDKVNETKLEVENALNNMFPGAEITEQIKDNLHGQG